MKFIAILRDSLRETLDVKLFYVMVGLSFLTILLVGSITYTPVTVEKRLTFFANVVDSFINKQPGNERLRVHTGIEQFQRSDKRQEPWLGDYQFDYVVTLQLLTDGEPTPAEQKQFEQIRKMLRDRATGQHLQNQLQQELFQGVQVTEAKPRDDLPANTSELRFNVTTKGTKIKSRQEWYHEPALFFGLVKVPVPLFTLAQIVRFIGDTVVGGFGGAFTLVISIIITASFLPGMLSKGTVDLLLVKPIHRGTLFVYKFLGGLLFMFLNTAVIMVGLYVVLGLQTGTWINSFLLCILVYTFQFAVIYAVSALTAVLTRSTIVCILISFMTWGFLFILGWAHWGFIEQVRANPDLQVQRYGEDSDIKSHWAYVGFDVFYALTPRYKELDWLTSKLIEKDLIQLRTVTPTADDQEGQAEQEQLQRRAKEIYDQQLKDLDKRYGSYTWTASLSVSAAFIVLVLGLACWIFAVKDY